MKVVLFLDPQDFPVGEYTLEVYRRQVEPELNYQFTPPEQRRADDNEYVVMRLKRRETK